MWVDRLTLCLTLCSVTLLGCGSSASGDLFGGGTGGDAGQGQGGSVGGFGGTFGSGAVSGFGGAGAISGFGGVGGTLGSGVGGTGGVGGIGGTGGTGEVCDFAGKWAAYTTIPMEWAATAVLAQGKGLLQVWLLTERTVNGRATRETGHLCGILLPSFKTITSETYGVRFLAPAFDHMPEFLITATVGAYEVGGAFDTDPAAIVFGTKLNNPTTDAWPPLTSLIDADDDRDGNPGVTTPAEKGNGYFDPLVSLLPVERANTLFVASRTVVILRGAATSCNELRGQLEVPFINGNPAFDSHIVGCKVSSTGAPCDATQTDFVDANGPDFRPGAGADFVQKRVPDNFSCAEVRGMYPAQPQPAQP